MKVIIVTCDRTPNYLRDTVIHLQSQRIDYIISHGSLSTNNLIQAGIKELSLLENVFDKDFEKYTTRKKATLNYINSLKLASSTKEDCVILEDDVLICNNFKENLDKIKKQIKEDKYILAIYFPYQTNIRELKPIDYKIDDFYGLQGMYYTNNITKLFADFLSKRIGIHPHDFLLKDFCKENNIKLYGTTLSLVQHIGKVSTGLGHHHTVGNFLNDYIK
jgi:hypothetical protein